MRLPKYLNVRFKSTFAASKMEATNVISVNNMAAENVAIQLLNNGGVISLPTDTVYGLACCATNKAGIEKMYSIKSRNENKPLAICVGKESDVRKWSIVSHLPDGMLAALFPGPVTLVLSTRSRLLDKSLTLHGKVGIRIPDYDFIRNVCDGLDGPIALTSANISSEPSSVCIEEFKAIWDKLNGVFDGGVLGVGDSNRSASTVVDLSEPNLYKIVREGIACDGTVDVLQRFGLKKMV